MAVHPTLFKLHQPSHLSCTSRPISLHHLSHFFVLAFLSLFVAPASHPVAPFVPSPCAGCPSHFVAPILPSQLHQPSHFVAPSVPFLCAGIFIPFRCTSLPVAPLASVILLCRLSCCTICPIPFCSGFPSLFVAPACHPVASSVPFRCTSLPPCCIIRPISLCQLSIPFCCTKPPIPVAPAVPFCCTICPISLRWHFHLFLLHQPP